MSTDWKLFAWRCYIFWRASEKSSRHRVPILRPVCPKSKKTYFRKFSKCEKNFPARTHLVVADVVAVGPEDVEVDDASLRVLTPVIRVRVHPEHRAAVPVPGPLHPAVQVRGQPERPFGHRSHGTGQRVQGVHPVADSDYRQEIDSAVFESANGKRAVFRSIIIVIIIFFSDRCWRDVSDELDEKPRPSAPRVRREDYYEFGPGPILSRFFGLFVRHTFPDRMIFSDFSNKYRWIILFLRKHDS